MILEVPKTRAAVVADRLILAFCVLLLLSSLVVLFDRRPPVVLIDGKIEPTRIRSGDPFMMSWDISWNRLCPAKIARTYVDWFTKLHPIDTTVATVPTQHGRITTVRGHILPPLPEGPAEYRMTMYFMCNPIQEWFPIEVDFPPQYFTVVK